MIQTTDTSERGLERLIADYLTDTGGYKIGRSEDYDRERGIDKAQLFLFLRETQPEEVDKLRRIHGEKYEERFAQRLNERLRKRGILYILRNGVRDRDAKLTLYQPRPSFGESFNEKAWARYQANRFSVTRQLRFEDKDGSSKSVDLAIFVNGLPIATMELKNNLTKQNVRDARRQYRRRDVSATLFQFRRCLIHFAVDDQLVSMTTKLDGSDTTFLPFNRGTKNNGAGNPPNPDGLKTAYLWENVLSKGSLNDILLKYAQLFEEKDEDGATKEKLIFPRYHQRDAVQQLLAHSEQHGTGRRYLIQHSTGSGKSFTITWLAHQLAELTDAAGEDTVFDTVIVITDRVHLDRQIRDYILQIDQKRGIVEAITQGSRQLKEALESGKKIITSTVQKFPHIVEAIGSLRQSSFAIVIDEAHSSQGGSFTAALNRVLGNVLKDQDFDTVEDALNALAESRKMPRNASYFAFTATPKEKTLELFGEVHPGKDEPQPFHTYTMKQAIEEGFIMDVLKNYMTAESYYGLLETAQDDPLVNKRRAHQQLRHFVETHEASIKEKARVMIDHFREEVVRKGKVGGRARAMVVTKSRELAIRYFWAFQTYLGELNAPMQAIVAFSDTKDVDGKEYTEAGLNGFSGDKIPDKFREKPYRFLIVADKYQTGYDEPLLHTMYVDKSLGGVNAVQTLSRLNRTHPDKTDTFVLDFQNDVDKIKRAFDDYYTTTLLDEVTDPNRLSNLEEELDNDFGVYTANNVTVLTDLFLKGADRDELDPILDTCRDRFENELDADEQRLFKQKARAFVRSYGFLSQIMTFEVAYWERLYYFLKFLLDKLPALEQEAPDIDILQHVDMESYRVEKRAAEQIQLDEANARLKPKSDDVPNKVSDPEQEYLSQVIREFNERFGGKWTEDKITRNFLFDDLPDTIADDTEFVRRIRSSDRQNARITVDERVVDEFQDLIMTQTDLYKKFTDDPEFKAFVQSMVFQYVYEEAPVE